MCLVVRGKVGGNSRAEREERRWNQNQTLEKKKFSNRKEA